LAKAALKRRKLLKPARQVSKSNIRPSYEVIGPVASEHPQ
jgi:hypothetical protein